MPYLVLPGVICQAGVVWQERDVLTGYHDVCHALVRARARSCAGGSSELDFEERRHNVEVLTQREYNCLCVIPMFMCDSRRLHV